MGIKRILRKILEIFKREEKQKTSYNTRLSATRVPESEIYARIRMRYRLRNLPKPGSQASRQDISKFFKGKGRQAPWYRKQIKKKVSPEEEI